MEYKKGDTVWTLLGWLLVKCKIIDVNTTYRDTEPGGVLFYTIDEPIGHDTTDFDITKSKEKAAASLINIFTTVVNQREHNPSYNFNAYTFLQYVSRMTLDEYRIGMIDAIANSHKTSHEEIKGCINTTSGVPYAATSGFGPECCSDKERRQYAPHVYEHFKKSLGTKKRGEDWFTVEDLLSDEYIKQIESVKSENKEGVYFCEEEA